MRSLIIATILCLCSAPAFACMYDTDCETHNICISGTCTPAHSSDDDNDAHNNAPAKRATKGKTCNYDGDCNPGSACIKGSGPEGVCLGR
jgi:hypothetical protein